MLSPWPRRPYSPKPQLYNSPLEVIAALWELPQAMSRIRFVLSASINRGLSQFLKQKITKSFNLIHRTSCENYISSEMLDTITPTTVMAEQGVRWKDNVISQKLVYILLKCPSLPSSPSPQEKTFPSTVKAMAWRPPECTATFFTT